MGEPRWISPRYVMVIHEILLAMDGGGPGVRDRGLLESALDRPRNLFLHESPDLCRLAASYIAGIVRNHPFVDGNERTGFMVGATFLEMNGLFFKATELDATEHILAVAAGELDEEQLTRWLRSVTDEADSTV